MKKASPDANTVETVARPVVQSVVSSSDNKIQAFGLSNVGLIRQGNEDTFIVDSQLGLYAVLDGMGGANAGDVASQLASEVIHQFVRDRNRDMAPKSLLKAALQAGSAAVYYEAEGNLSRKGMGTTVVACMMISASRAIIAHVGDSRAYVLREGALKLITRDHTVVDELVLRGSITEEEAERHPYKNVLSRNLGAKPEPIVDVQEFSVQPGDRILLCSDGLYGYAAADALQYIVGSGDRVDDVCADLIDAALRGGGGDNVTAVLIETTAVTPTATAIVRGSGAIAWWQKRHQYFEAVLARGFTDSALCHGMTEKDAMALYAGNLCQAIFHDLEKSSAFNVWTFAQNMAHAWLTTTTDRRHGGDWPTLRAGLDILIDAAKQMVDEIAAADAQLGFLVSIAIGRALTVAELAIGSILTERVREVEEQLVTIFAAAPTAPGADATGRFHEQATIPFLRNSMPMVNADVTSVLLGAVRSALHAAAARSTNKEQLQKTYLALEALATSAATGADVLAAAQELFGVHTFDDASISPVFEALDRARMFATTEVHALELQAADKLRVMRLISVAHQRLVTAAAGVVVDSAAPANERLQDTKQANAMLREQLQRAESKRALLERQFATATATTHG
jgi:PPM family protein phosphatase